MFAQERGKNIQLRRFCKVQLTLLTLQNKKEKKKNETRE